MKIKFVGEIKKWCWLRNPQATWPVYRGLEARGKAPSQGNAPPIPAGQRGQDTQETRPRDTGPLSRRVITTEA